MLRRRRRQAEEPLDFLTTEGSDEPEAIVPGGSEWFGERWHARTDADEATDRAVDEFAVDDDFSSVTALAKQLSKRPRGPLLLLAAVAALGATAAIGVRQGWFDASAADDDPPLAAVEELIVAPGEQRSYEGDPFRPDVDLIGRLDRSFGSTGGGGSELVPDPPTELQSDVAFMPLLWGERLQTLVVGPPDMLERGCLVVTLATERLEALDVAGAGACPDIEAVTGDRVSCLGPGIALVEIWPPISRSDLFAPPESPASLRVRIERTDLEPWDRLSIRGEIPFDDDRLAGVVKLGAEPGDTFRANLGDATGACTLLDRSDVLVRVL